MKVTLFPTLLLAAALLTACGTARKAATPDRAPIATAPSQAPTNVPAQFVADLDLGLTAGQDEYSLGGKLSMKRDKVMRINLTFMGFVEVGIIEFTPTYILVVNRMGREYTKAPYDSMDALRKNNITFASLQTMAWERLYAADGKKQNQNALGETLARLINQGITDPKKQVAITITIGKPDTRRDFETYTTPKSSYKEVPAQLLMARLMSFAK